MNPFSYSLQEMLDASCYGYSVVVWLKEKDTLRESESYFFCLLSCFTVAVFVFAHAFIIIIIIILSPCTGLRVSVCPDMFARAV